MLVRWYLALSCRDIEELALERGLKAIKKVKRLILYFQNNVMSLLPGRFEKAMGSNGIPDKVTMDKSGANKAGIDYV